MREIDEATFDSLSSKLDGLDLTEDERSVLELVLDRAQENEAEVVGFNVHGLPKTGLSAGGIRIGVGSGLMPRPTIGQVSPGDFRPPPP